MKRITILNILAGLMIASLPTATLGQKSPAAEPTAPAAEKPTQPTAVEPTTPKKPKAANKPGKGAKPTAAESAAPAKPTAAEPTTAAKPGAAEPAGPTVALDPSSLNDIENATKAMNDCAALADEIAAQKVPENYVKVRKNKATKKHPENKPDPDNEKRKAERAKKAEARAAEEAAIAKGPKNPKGDNPPAPKEPSAPVATNESDDLDDKDPASNAFIEKMDALVKRFDTCGEEYERAAKASEKVMKTLSKSKLSKDDAATAGAAAAKNQAAREKLAASVAGLSNDRQIQAYVHPVLKAHYLKL